MYYSIYCVKKRVMFFHRKYPLRAVTPNLTLGADHFHKFFAVTNHDLILPPIISLSFLILIVYNLYV